MMEQSQSSTLPQKIDQSWSKIPPLWPLSSFIAVNPLQGLEDLAFKKALTEASIYFQQTDFPEELNVVNRQTIKWMQAFFDKGQATISMPLRINGLYNSLRELLPFDQELFSNNFENKKWLQSLPKDPNEAILNILQLLEIPENSHIDFLTLSLTTLPGWASYIKYFSEWNTHVKNDRCLETEYLATRLIFMFTLWPKSLSLVHWYDSKKKFAHNNISYDTILLAEEKYQKYLIKELRNELVSSEINDTRIQVQLIFCIDVRSEPFRKALESVGKYETLGFAGFFGLPVRVENCATSESYDSCPVLLKSSNQVKETKPTSIQSRCIDILHRLYQLTKYTFTSPFLVVEALGIITGVLMFFKTMFPRCSYFLQKKLFQTDNQQINSYLDTQSIPFNDQCQYAENVLTMLGLTTKFKRLIVFSGHGSSTINNAYASALDCGACGAKQGGVNARILALILNSSSVREYLKHKKIIIPSETVFIGAQHNTTTDEMFLYESDIKDIEKIMDLLHELKSNISLATKKNNLQRARLMGYKGKEIDAPSYIQKQSQDWAQTRPEWGLAKNASFIIAPRNITKKIDLGGRAFLHSYDYKNDSDGSFLTTILTAPVIVAQWINYQYLFSTIDNVAYGSGSKITQNITGKFGIMQGNSSDLMFGLPLQSLYICDKQAYHEPVRLQTFVYAPKAAISKIILEQSLLQKLLGNQWLFLICIQPTDNNFYLLNRDFSWKKIDT